MTTAQLLLPMVVLVFGTIGCGSRQRSQRFLVARAEVAPSVRIAFSDGYADGEFISMRAVVQNQGRVPVIVDQDAWSLRPRGEIVLRRTSASARACPTYQLDPGETRDCILQFAWAEPKPLTWESALMIAGIRIRKRDGQALPEQRLQLYVIGMHIRLRSPTTQSPDAPAVNVKVSPPSPPH
jgi:hypothetical protein